ncbi:hypothetical protein [Dinoroseobacter sp. S124A]|uniref:hypothetical protein n=1 Tax=Dinoroseobacter sp. S124A TaxID=3415128 RepID=UPI003C7D5F66
MPTFGVTLPVAGHAWLEVQAEDEDSAIETAMEVVTSEDFVEWEPLRHITQGNVCYAPTWDAEAVLVPDIKNRT